MKTKPSIVILSIGFILSCSINVFSQQGISDFNKSFENALNTMIKNASLEAKANDDFCKAEDLIGKINPSQNLLNESGVLSTYDVFMVWTNRDGAVLPLEKFEESSFKTISDRALNALSITTDFNNFVYAFTGNHIETFEASEVPLSLERDYSELGRLKWFYTSYKNFFSNPIPITKMLYFSDDCKVTLNSKLLTKKLDFPSIEYTLNTEVIVDCNCNDDSNPLEIKYGVLDYEADVTGIFTSSKITFDEVSKAKVSVRSIACCPFTKDEEEPALAALNENGDCDDCIEDLMPDQTIGVGAGVGFAQDFDETLFCFTAEYLYQLNDDKYKGWYVGAEGSYSNTSFGDISTNKTMVGGKVQHNFSAVPSGQTQFVAGLMANYAFGNNDFNGTKDDFSGTIFCAYAGANIRVSENWSVGLQFPFLIFENFTFKPEGGGEFKTDNTTLFINKDNPLKIILRRRL